MKQFYRGENKSSSGGSSGRAKNAQSQDATSGVPLTGWEAKRPAPPQQPRGMPYREAKNGKGIPPSIASNSDNKTGSSRSCWSYASQQWNAPQKKHAHVGDRHDDALIAERRKAYTSMSTAAHRSNYASRADPRSNTESSSPRMCLVKRLNGNVEQIDMKDIHTAFPNYIPYERKDNNALLSSVFCPEEDAKQTQGKVGDISNLPVVYQNVELNLDLVKKCRQASTSRKAFSDIPMSRNRQRSDKPSAKIKLPIGTPPASQTARGSHQKAAPPSRSFSCNNAIYNAPPCHPSNGLRSTSQKRNLSKVPTWKNAPAGESNFSSSGRSPIRRFQSAQNATTLPLRSPEVVTPKRDATRQTSLLKPHVIPMLLKHSTNMILSQLKKMKGNQRIHTKGTTMKVKNTKQQEAQFEQRSFSKKQMDKQPTADGKMDQVVYPRYNSSSVKDCHQVVVGSNSGGSSPVGGKNGDLTLQGLLAKKTKVKSIEKEKYIEKVNAYKVVYQSHDFVSIYQNGGDRTIKDHCIDVSSLLCIPGYVGGYLCESNSTVNHSHANGKGNPQVEGEQEEDTKRRGSTASARSFTTHPQPEQGQLWIDPDVDLLNDDPILYHLRKAVNSSPTLNVDLQYLVLLNERLKNREPLGDSLWGWR
ncbi:conserved Plasmodium protein, unknown function [Plasmodium vivax]|uniref:Uncharacterized protein n=1 Tax=Plasmodium vivax TaxID=5855 RepID=A0A1G4GY55_PLAVI|nr:conserved Plasmodium protein, unknown function [Plasmodium vivax]SCO67547.1 conserved Plasmodium protein, unknown function [Plasmodium vivax]VUZ96131.1 conserved Plasmodium protein, unknown function [Plasmodium vivax]